MLQADHNPRYVENHRVLVLAEAANPEWASVPLVGWNIYRALARVSNTHLVTHVRNRDAILRAGLAEGRDFTTIDNENIAAPLYRLATLLRGGTGKGWTTLTAFSSVAYYSFEQEVWRRFRKRIAAGDFDIVHRVTPLSPTSQSLIAKRIAALGIPFVIGPLNGGVPWPPNFRNRQHQERDWLTHIRFLFKLMPGYRSTRQHSAAILVGSRYTLSELPAWAKRKAVYLPENGIDDSYLFPDREQRPNQPLRAAFVGRLVPYKGADVLLRAASEFLKSGALELHIVGDGPQRPVLESLIESLGVRRAVHLYGWQPHEFAVNKMRECDFLALPSVREFGGGVVVEAMAAGIPAIVADYAGPAELLDEQCGIRVAFHDEESLLLGFEQAIRNFVDSPEELRTFGRAAQMKARERLTWAAKALQIQKIYDAVRAGRTDLRKLQVY